MKHIIDLKELHKIGRPIGKVSDDKLEAYVTEAEQLHIKPVIGDSLFHQLQEETEKVEDGQKGETLQMLLCGGSYTVNEGCENEVERCFVGLRVALSYFVYAQNLMVGDIESTRYGAVIKNGDFSNHVSSKERSDAYNNTVQVANAYMKECLEYCRFKGLIKVAGKPKATIGGITIRKIG